MILVIGVSTTIEYGLKWGYETTVGRVAELALGPETTAEDRLAAEVARGYVDFLDIEPWYRFDFVDPLRRVWAETGLWGDHPLRKWERKYFLTSEYAAKAVYGWLIRRSSESAYGVEATTTAVLVDRLPPEAERDLPKAEILERFDDGAVLLLVRRYQAFTGDAHTLTRNGATFIEIAGNRGPILISALVPADYAVDHGNLLMTQPISTRPGRRRILMTVPVSELAKTVAALETPDVELEHIYDY